MKELLKFLSIGIGATVIIVGGVLMFFLWAFNDGLVYYSKKDLIRNYEERSKQITELEKYVNTIVPAGKNFEIEFADDDELEIFHIINNGTYNSNWKLKINSLKTDSLLSQIGWTKQTLKELKRKLNNANCISVTSGEPITIGFKRSGMGLYFYKLFAKPLNDTTRNKYNDGCTYSFYKDNVVLEYGGGAIGPQCFEDFKYPNNK